MRLSKSMILLVAMLLVACTGLFAQTPTAEVNGTVLDSSGGTVPGADVKVTNEDTNIVSEKPTSPDGTFTIINLLPGNYVLSVEKSGFKTITLPVFTLDVNQILTEKLTMLVGSSAETVTVSAEGTLLQSSSSELGTTIATHVVEQLPLNGRNFSQLITLAPGVSNQTGQDEALVGVKGSVNYSVNGGRVEYNTYDVDGGDILNASINGSHSTLIVYPSIDAINELQVLTSNYGAMYGRSASGTILATTKSGGPSFHGDGYFFARNNIFNARNFFDQTKSAPLYQKYEPGGTIGGPVYIPGHYNVNKDKTFFFFSEEYRHDREPVEFNEAVPSLAERNCANGPNPNTTCLNPGSSLPAGATRYGDFSDVCPAATAPGQIGSIVEFSRTPGGVFDSRREAGGFFARIQPSTDIYNDN